MVDLPFLTSDDVAGLATPTEYVGAVRDAYQQVGEGAPAKTRTKLTRDSPSGMMTGYLAVLPDTGAMGGYMYAAGFGADDAWFVAPLFDAESGEPVALIDGASMNPFKTGAAGAVAIDELARDNATTFATVGTGPQARGQLRAAAAVRDLTKVRAYARTPENREEFAEEMDKIVDADVRAVKSSSEAVNGADIVVTATTASEPVVADADIADGTHITAMGQYDPGKREIEAQTVARTKYVPDLRERATHDAGAFIQAVEEGVIGEDHIHADLGEVVAGEAPGREFDDEVTLFDSGGTGVETVGAAHMLYQKAMDKGLGSTISLSPASEALTGQ